MQRRTFDPPVGDDLADHINALREELEDIVDAMTAIGATSAAAAHYSAMRTCVQFLNTPEAPEIQA